MIHKMKLNESPFERIKNGTKTVEFRLYDEKRQQIKIGDKIEFSKHCKETEAFIYDVAKDFQDEIIDILFKDVDKIDSLDSLKSYLEMIFNHLKNNEEL